MGVIGLKGFLTDEHHSWVVVAAGDLERGTRLGRKCVAQWIGVAAD